MYKISYKPGKVPLSWKVCFLIIHLKTVPECCPSQGPAGNRRHPHIRRFAGGPPLTVGAGWRVGQTRWIKRQTCRAPKPTEGSVAEDCLREAAAASRRPPHWLSVKCGWTQPAFWTRVSGANSDAVWVSRQACTHSASLAFPLITSAGFNALQFSFQG